MERCEVARLDLLHFSICAHLAMSQESSKHCPLHKTINWCRIRNHPLWVLFPVPLIPHQTPQWYMNYVSVFVVRLVIHQYIYIYIYCIDTKYQYIPLYPTDPAIIYIPWLVSHDIPLLHPIDSHYIEFFWHRGMVASHHVSQTPNSTCRSYTPFIPTRNLPFFVANWFP